MKHYVYASKEQILDFRLDNIDKNIISKIKSRQDVIKDAASIISNIVDRDVSVAVIDINGKVVLDSSKSKLPYKEKVPDARNVIPKLIPYEYKQILLQNSNSKVYKIIKDKNENESIGAFLKIGDASNRLALIQISTSTQEIHNILSIQIIIYLIASILILIIGIVIGKKVLGSTLAPLYNMADTVEKITIGQLNMRLRENNKQVEIDRLSIAFNDMLERIETSFKKEKKIKEKMRSFISDASHELRTPLTSIHGFVEVLLRGAAKNEKQLNLALNTILLESDRLEELVNELLVLNKSDQKSHVEMLDEDISDIVCEVYPQLKILAGERKLELNLEKNVFIYANRNQIKQVIINIVQNAIQHTDSKNGLININSRENVKESLVVLEIKDNGTGIPKEDLNEIFDRFFRSDSHRARKSGGYGLGLSIVSSIVDAHNAEIKVNSEIGKGTSFSVYFKKNQ
ncbi:sensor histidine kinase [Clostridium psychrophilum]|uniref:sensor histidine kinase n=1 Tax=Clostridium psychrophilum TaxID=132926 RepID=UPI0028B1AFB8|nr:ATP-binding protein [Clostridium psychrophilum]